MPQNCQLSETIPASILRNSAGNAMWMDEILRHLRNYGNPSFLSIFRRMESFQIFFQVVLLRNGFCPSTVGRPISTCLAIAHGALHRAALLRRGAVAAVQRLRVVHPRRHLEDALRLPRKRQTHACWLNWDKYGCGGQNRFGIPFWGK